jgi:hypothetical protein
MMKRKTAALILTAMVVVVVDSHVDWETIDGRGLLNINGIRMDPVGWVRDKAQTTRRDCAWYTSPTLDSAVGQSVMKAIARHSPPDSAQARWHQARQDGHWLIAELSFERISPAVVLLQRQGDRWLVHPKAVWSGSTEPWYPNTRIRDHLMQQAPEAPKGLIACFTPKQDFRSWSLKP